jgi:hypothetical protein
MDTQITIISMSDDNGPKSGIFDSNATTAIIRNKMVGID